MYTVKQILREFLDYNWDAYSDTGTAAEDRAYLWEGMIKDYIVQEMESKKQDIQSQQEFQREIDSTIEDIKAELDLTFSAISDNIGNTPFEEFYNIEQVSDKNEWK